VSVYFAFKTIFTRTHDLKSLGPREPERLVYVNTHAIQFPNFQRTKGSESSTNKPPLSTAMIGFRQDSSEPTCSTFNDGY